jgi:NAD(P)-dependent dehydrogenase (short-subunit alcohol dehydrogenase family)
MVDTRIALVTGANKGIGLEIARQLAEAGVHVIIGARDAERGRAAAANLAGEGLLAEVLALDLLDPASIAAAARQIGETHGKLDILVNNAGIFDPADGQPGKASLDAVRRVMETNFFGTLAITQAMLPLLRSAGTARIVNLASSLGSLTLNGDPQSRHYSAQFVGCASSGAERRSNSTSCADRALQWW